MSDWNDSWVDSWWNTTWYDRRQNRRMQGLADDLSYVSSSLHSARSSQRRLQAELSKMSGTLEQRIATLSAAFDAFVEISDLRMTLGLFDAQAMARHQARELFSGAQLTGEVSDVDGYWLPPALTGLLVAADGVVDTEALEVAKARDALRTTALHVLGTAVLGGRKTVSAEMLGELLPAFDPALPRYQRAAWTLAADGFFGEVGAELARRRGVDFLRGLGETERAAAVEALRGIAAKAEPVTVPRQLDGAREITSGLEAVARLAALREWVDEALAGRTNEPAEEPDEVVRETLQLLVDEGSPVELPLLARERELRAVIEGTGSESPAWDGPVGETVQLLRGDVTDTEHPDRRALAVRVSGEHLLSIADELAAVAKRPAPSRVPTRTRYGQVTVTLAGAEPGSMAKAASLVDRSVAVDNQRRVMAYTAAGVAVGLVVLAVIGGWGWLIPAVVALGVAAVVWRVDVKQRKDAVEYARSAKEQLRSDLERRATQFAELRDRLDRGQSEVDDHLAALRTALN